MHELMFMPEQERLDFEFYWKESFGALGNRKNPGGDLENNGVDYSQYLIPWCKGNSVSVDQNTLKEPRDIISLLINNYKNALHKIDSGKSDRRVVMRNRSCGITYYDIKDKLQQEPFAKSTRRGRLHTGDLTHKWTRVERILQLLLWSDHIALFSTDQNWDEKLQTKIKEKITNDITTGRGLVSERNQHYICNIIYERKSEGAHLRISANQKGWDTFVRDHFGAPLGIDGLTAGDMSTEGMMAQPKTIPYPLHLIFAECIARAFAVKGEWGKNQTIIRRNINDLAIDGNGSSISLDAYYNEFSRNGAGHMADFMIQRSIGDNTSATYKLMKIKDSEPWEWRIMLDPDMIRWRELGRERERERGNNE